MCKKLLTAIFIIFLATQFLPGCKHHQKSKEDQAKEEAKKQKLGFIDERIVYFEDKLKDTMPAKMKGEMEALRNFLKAEKEKILAGVERSEN